MGKKQPGRSRGFQLKAHCRALSLLILCSFAIPSRAAQIVGQSLAFDPAVHDIETFPEGCGQAFQETNRFAGFFDSSLNALVAKRGAAARGVPELFAVSEMRNEIISVFPNYAEESPIDRLVISQLCQFQRIRAQQLKPGALEQAKITAGDDELHNHLVAVSANLYRDARKIVVVSMAEKMKEQERLRQLMSKRSEILRARQLGREKLQDLFAK